nr:phage tail protein [Clostridium beijerinckii]
MNLIKEEEDRVAENFYTILTTIGKYKLANSAASSSKVNFKTLQLGDGGGLYYEPSEKQTSLVKKVWEGNINSISMDKLNSNCIVIETIIPASDGGFFIREAGIFDEVGDLISISKVSETYKPVISEGSTKDLSIKIILEVTNAGTINLTVDPNEIVASKNDIQVLKSKLQEVSAELSGKMRLYIGETLPNISDRRNYTLYFKINNGSADDLKVSPTMGIKVVE